MSENKRQLPIIGNGEQLIEPISKSSFGSVKYPRTYSQAKERLIRQIETIKEKIKNIPADKRMSDVVITLRLHEKFLAKSYIPYTLFKQTEMENIGSRRWEFYKENKKKYSKMHFVRVSMDKLNRFENILKTNESELADSFKNDVRKLEEISLLGSDEIIQGFEENWKEGTVEFVLHPYGDRQQEMIEKFIKILKKNNINTNNLKVKTYQNGPTFVSAYINKSVLIKLSDFNPLRTVHPLKVNFFPELRKSQINPLKIKPPVSKSISEIKVGVFDGGIDENHPFLNYYAKENGSVLSTPDVNGIIHGTAVAGVILYGDLNKYEIDSQLSDPIVTVESFRVLPQSDKSDLDLYEAIDYIEKVVPSRPDIYVYNLSFGPVGPILDDEISRFTYALDKLAWEYKKLFVVAVGNDGQLDPPYNRIQAPSDIVNGLGVGAYTYHFKNGEKIRAPYSCVGDGREGCKVKPDLVAFGGDDHFPIHLLSNKYDERWLGAGTSFSAPIIASKAAEILGRVNQFNPIVARALLVHSAQNPKQVDNEIGYGIMDQDVDEILRCDENQVTIIYSSSINPKAYAKLPIPFPLNKNNYSGEVEIIWTIATLSKTNPLHIEDYTESAIEDTFYPHHKKYKLHNTKINKTRILHIDDNKELINSLISDGWTISSIPASSSPLQYQTEQARRGELKWDTVVKKWVRKRMSSLEKPFIILHGLGRNENTERINYAMIVTIKISKYQGNLYKEILNEYRELDPISIRNRNEIMVPISQ